MLFPIDINFISTVSKTAYTGDSGTDIGAPVGTPVVAIGDGTIVYAERGHTSWNKPPDTANSARIRLDNPINHGGRIYTEVFYTHLSCFTPRAKGSRIKAGDSIGRVGLGRGVPHLHISFYADDGRYISSKEGQRLMWDEWLPEQTKPYEEEDVEMTKQITTGTKARFFANTGNVRGKDGVVFLTLAADRGREATIDIIIFPENKLSPREIVKPILAKGLKPITKQLGKEIKGKFTIDISSKDTFTVELEQWF